MKDLTYQQSSGEHAKKTRWAQHRKTEGRKATDGWRSISLQGTVPPPPFLPNPVTAHKAVEKAPGLP